MKRLLMILAILMLLAAAAAGLLWQRYQTFLATPITLNEELMLIIAPGDLYRDLVVDLAERDLIEPDWRWRLLGRLSPDAARLKAGEYQLGSGTPEQWLATIASGATYQHSLTLIDGWSIREVLQAVRQHPALELTLDYQLLESEPEWLSELLSLSYPHPEGLFMPDTYRFPRGTRDTAFLQRAHRLQMAQLQRLWSQRADALPYQEPYEALIMASIIEKETGLAAERPQIAGVFVRRLNRRMRLQTDPTVIYGMGADFDGDIRFADLRRDTPYNTYTRHGLPPTPIAMPGEAAIHAALHPAAGETLYFVSRGDGSHVFSRTLEEHNAAVNTYQRGSR